MRFNRICLMSGMNPSVAPCTQSASPYTSSTRNSTAGRHAALCAHALTAALQAMISGRTRDFRDWFGRKNLLLKSLSTNFLQQPRDHFKLKYRAQLGVDFQKTLDFRTRKCKEAKPPSRIRMRRRLQLLRAAASSAAAATSAPAPTDRLFRRR